MQPGIQQPGTHQSGGQPSGAHPGTATCQQCGAELRAGARFCNRCGAAQPPTSAANAPATAQTAPTTQAPAAPIASAPQSVLQTAPAAPAVAETLAPPSPDMDESARVKRPPRVPRVREGEEASEGESELAGEEPSAPSLGLSEEALETRPQPATTAQEAEEEMPVLAVTDEVVSAPNGPPPVTAPAQLPAQPPLEPSPAAASAPSEPVAAPAAPEATSAAGPERAAETAPASLDWPLAPGTLAGGRYRVEAVLSAAQSATDENVYRVTDRQGYERCWSCGATYTPTEGEPPEEYCAQCGADMLARPYLMRERMLPADAVAEPAVEQAEPASGARVFREAGREFAVSPEEIERSPFTAGAHVVIACASDTGRGRSHEANEDSVAQLAVQAVHESYAEPLALGIVADGLGGHASGSEASRMVVHTVLGSVLGELVTPILGGTTTRLTDEAVKQVLRDAITAANAALHAANDESKRDMGSTLVAALILGETAYIANVGDSRAYVYDGAELRRLTTDHSLVEQLVAGGMIAPEERYTHPSRNQIYRSLGVGSGDDLSADIYTQRLRPGLRLLLCSDGLWEMVHDDEIAQILHQMPHPQGACDALIAAANANGGEDNISALILDVTD